MAHSTHDNILNYMSMIAFMHIVAHIQPSISNMNKEEEQMVLLYRLEEVVHYCLELLWMMSC